MCSKSIKSWMQFFILNIWFPFYVLSWNCRGPNNRYHLSPHQLSALLTRPLGKLVTMTISINHIILFHCSFTENIARCRACDVKRDQWIKPDMWLEEHCQVCCLSALPKGECVWSSSQITEAHGDVWSDSFMDISPDL